LENLVFLCLCRQVAGTGPLSAVYGPHSDHLHRARTPGTWPVLQLVPYPVNSPCQVFPRKQIHTQ
jgi:hypothetical protein